MRKIVTPDSWDFNEPSMVQIPLLQNRKLGSHDRKALESRMSGDMLEQFSKMAFGPGIEPVHITAVGCTEAYGPNRNGDGFRQKICEEYHPTFVKFARFFRGHKSGPGAKFYGTVKLSQFHPKMRRIDLVAGLFATKAAAAEHGSLAQMADIEMHKLASGEDISTSMGCAVSHDICSHCGNKAQTPKSYCTESMCKAGGLKHHMGEVQADGSILHADNPDPQFNDISHVKRGADRISFLIGALRKTAGCDGPMTGGAELAELIYTPEYETKLSRMAQDMARIEARVHQFGKFAAGCSECGRPGNFVVPEGVRDERKLVQACAALADEGIILPVDEFVELITGQKKAGASVRAELPGIYERLECPLVNPFTCYEQIPSQYRVWAAQMAPSYSLEKSAVARRIGIASVRGLSVTSAPQQKRASSSALAAEAAQQYALYVLSALDRNARNENLGLTATLSLLQNQTN